MSRAPLCVVILAAGQGTRMKSELAKVLHPVGGRAMISHVLATADALGAERSVVVIGKEMQAVAEHVAPAPTVIQDPPRGTADAVMAAKEHIDGFEGDILILYGDTPLLTVETLNAMREARTENQAAVVVLGFTPSDPAQYGRLVVSDAGGLERIVEYRDCSETEKAIPLCNAGVMLIDGARALDLLRRIGNDNAKGEYYLTDIVALAKGDGAVCAVVEAAADEVTGVNSRAELAVAEAAFQKRIRARMMEAGVTLIDPETVYFSADTLIAPDVTIHPHVVIGPGVRIAKGAVIEAFSHLEGAEVGEGASIGPYARLRPGAKIGTGAKIGNFVEVKKAEIGEGAKANHLAYIGDARIGAGANIGAGTITCNYDGFSKHHTEIGAGAFIGSNTALVAPVTIGKGAIIGAGSTITADVEDDAIAVERAAQRSVKSGAERFRAAHAKKKK